MHFDQPTSDQKTNYDRKWRHLHRTRPERLPYLSGKNYLLIINNYQDLSRKEYISD